MHTSTTALYVILLSILGTSKTALAVLDNAEPKHDAFGVTNYGFECDGRVYPKYRIYAAAKHYCDNIQDRPDLKSIHYVDTGYRNKVTFNLYGHDSSLGHPTNSHYILPILQDGTLYPFELKPELRLIKNPDGQTVKVDPGPDRLVIDTECKIKTAFSDVHYKNNIAIGTVHDCRVLKSYEDYLRLVVNPSRGRSPSSSPRHRSPHRSPKGNHHQSPQRSHEHYDIDESRVAWTPEQIEDLLLGQRS